MAKQLRTPPPSSSVARLLDVSAAARAVAPVEGTALVPPPPLPPTAAPAGVPAFRLAASLPANGEFAAIKREFVLSPSTDRTFSDIVDLFRRATGTRLTSSHVARALLKSLAPCIPAIEREARRVGPQRLPSNARGREAERERFENRIARALSISIRSSAAFESDE